MDSEVQESRRCLDCFTEKPLQEFARNGFTKDGRQIFKSSCKKCFSAYSARLQIINKVKRGETRYMQCDNDDCLQLYKGSKPNLPERRCPKCKSHGEFITYDDVKFDHAKVGRKKIYDYNRAYKDKGSVQAV